MLSCDKTVLSFYKHISSIICRAEPETNLNIFYSFYEIYIINASRERSILRDLPCISKIIASIIVM